MKRKISILLCAVLAAFLVTACSSDNQAEYDTETLEQATEVLIEYCASADEATTDQWKSLTDFELEYQLMQSGLPFTPEGFLGALDAWPAAVEECGAYIGHGDFTITAEGDEINVTTTGEFEDRNAEITVVYDSDSRLDSLSVSAEYGVGEILQKSGLNTILGMGTVFVVLIFISIVISLLKYIPVLGEKLKKKNQTGISHVEASGQAGASPSAPAKEAEAPEDQGTEDDSELIAVITAAIAAAQAESGSEGGMDGFVVRSIRRRPSNKWKA